MRSLFNVLVISIPSPSCKFEPKAVKRFPSRFQYASAVTFLEKYHVKPEERSTCPFSLSNFQLTVPVEAVTAPVAVFRVSFLIKSYPSSGIASAAPMLKRNFAGTIKYDIPNSSSGTK